MNRREFVTAVASSLIVGRHRSGHAAGRTTINFLGLLAFRPTANTCDIAFVKAPEHKAALLIRKDVGNIQPMGTGSPPNQDAFEHWLIPGAHTDYEYWPVGGEVVVDATGTFSATKVEHLVPMKGHCGTFKDNWQSATDAHLTLVKGTLESTVFKPHKNTYKHHQVQWYLYDGSTKVSAQFDLTNIVRHESRVNSISFGNKQFSVGSDDAEFWLINLPDKAHGDLNEAEHCKAYHKLCNKQAKEAWPKRVKNVSQLVPTAPDPIYCPPAMF